MAKPKSKSHGRNNQQLQLRVFSQIDGGKSAQGRQGASAGDRAVHREKQVASAEDKAIYQAIADRYFDPKR